MSPKKPVSKDASAVSPGRDGDGVKAVDADDEMFSQTQPCASPQSQSYHSNTDPSPKLPSRRKLAYPAMVCKDVVLVEDLTTDTSVEYAPRGTGNHKHNKRKRKREDGSPLRELPDLSQTQKIYSQSSTLDTLSTQTNGVSHNDEGSESMSGDHVGKQTRATMAGKEKQTNNDEDSNPESSKMTSDMNLQWSDNEEDLVRSEMSSSPVFPEESRLQQAEARRPSPEYRVSAWQGTSSHSPKCLRLSPLPAAVAVQVGGSDTTTTSCLQDPQSGAGPSHTQEPSSQVSALPERPRGEPLVHYYWGVPFCPQGLDPDVYTQVILAQMEVYEKSLKHAQRSLLKKAEWGEGITPKTETQPDSPSLLQIQSLPPSMGDQEEEAEEEEDHTQDLDKKDEVEEDGGGNSEQLAVMSPSREEELLPVQEEEETERAVDVERKDTAHAKAVVLAVRPVEVVSTVDCPICQSAFPASEIEMHAAFCDGEQEVECAEDHSPGGKPQSHAFSVSLRPNKRRALKSLATEEHVDSDASGRAQEVIDLCLNDDEEDSEEGGSGQPRTFRISDSPIRAFRSISEASDCLVDFRRQIAPRQPSHHPRGRRGGGGVKRKFKRR
ncbi:unnamed protein product [Merluccius merluccius]